MTIQEAINQLYQDCKTAYPCLEALTPDEACGFTYCLRWCRYSPIPGGWTDAMLLPHFREYFKARAEMVAQP